MGGERADWGFPMGHDRVLGVGVSEQTHKNLELLLETKAGAAVMISEKLGCLCPLLNSEMLALFSVILGNIRVY